VGMTTDGVGNRMSRRRRLTSSPETLKAGATREMEAERLWESAEFILAGDTHPELWPTRIRF
jgi:hypothetical protein